MATITEYSAKGTKLGTLRLPKIFDEKENKDLLAQAIHVYQAGSHIGQSVVQTRSEVARTKAKWYRQKGTGRARHGARSAPIFVGGGKAHGPRVKSRQLTLSKKMRQKALSIAFSNKAREKRVVAVKGIGSLKKTAEVAKLLLKITKDTKGKKYTFFLAEENLGANRFIRNLENAKTCAYRNANAYKVYKGGTLVIDSAVFEKAKKSVKKK